MSPVLATVVSVLAVYGLMSIVQDIIRSVAAKSGLRGETKIVLHVKNRQDSIEGLIRSYALKVKLGMYQRGAELIVVDHGSTDETREIILRLCKYYRFLRYMTADEYAALA